MDIDFKEIVLSNYGGIKLKANVEENPKDIIAAVLYNDHGDEFLVVKTKDHIYEYGYWLNRKFFANYNEIDRDPNHRDRKWFARIPKLVGPEDDKAQSSNEIFFAIENTIRPKNSWGTRSSWGIQKYYSKDSAEWKFSYMCEEIKKEFETKRVYHFGEDKINDIRKFLEENEILTDENCKRLEELRTYLRIGAIDGVAGKKSYNISDCEFYGDTIKWVYYQENKITKKYNKHGIKVKAFYENTEWGPFNRFCISMDQFQ